MNRFKKFTALILTLGLAVSILAGCGVESQSKEGDKTITIGATPSPHEEILNALKDEFQKEGYTLKVVPFTDYVLPNKALESGDLDANYFQHEPYLLDFNEENKLNLVNAGSIHYEPMAIFKGTANNLDELTNGSKVAVPNDTTNEARALLLLQDNGLIKLKDGADIKATKKDIVENPKNLEIVEIEAAQIPRSLGDVAIAVVNGNYAIPAGLNLNDALAKEEVDSLAAKTYANIIAVREADKDSEKTKVIIKVLTGEKAKEFITEHYKGSVLPI